MHLCIHKCHHFIFVILQVPMVLAMASYTTLYRINMVLSGSALLMDLTGLTALLLKPIFRKPTIADPSVTTLSRHFMSTSREIFGLVPGRDFAALIIPLIGL